MHEIDQWGKFDWFDILGQRNGKRLTLIPSSRDSEIDLSLSTQYLFPYSPSENTIWRMWILLLLPSWINGSELTAGALKGIDSEVSFDDQVNLERGWKNGKLELPIRSVSYSFLDLFRLNWTFNNLSSKKVRTLRRNSQNLKAGEALWFYDRFNSIGKAGENRIDGYCEPKNQQSRPSETIRLIWGAYFLVEGDNSTFTLDVNSTGITSGWDIVSPMWWLLATLKNNQTLIYKKTHW